MTLEEARSTKMTAITAVIDKKVNPADIWFKVCILPNISIVHEAGETKIKFRGTFDDGLYVINKISEASQEVGGGIYMEIKHYYERR